MPENNARLIYLLGRHTVPAVIVGTMLIILASVLIVSLREMTETARRQRNENGFRRIAAAMDSYHNIHRRYPERLKVIPRRGKNPVQQSSWSTTASLPEDLVEIQAGRSGLRVLDSSSGRRPAQQ